MLVVEVAPNALRQLYEILRPLQLGNVEVKQLLILLRQRLGQLLGGRVVILPLGEDELLQPVQRFPHVRVEAHQHGPTAGHPQQQVQHQCGQYVHKDRGQLVHP